ncbi:MAG: DUF1015 family protein [Candidatus Accumulibacter sp.]|nr:DUF1015 family protein [Accumulibacter sp.]
MKEPTPIIRPFGGLRPLPERAPEIVAPPYDVLSVEEARDLAKGKPNSFLHISRAEIDLPPDIHPYAPEVYHKSAQNFRRMMAGGLLIRDKIPCYYAYRMRKGLRATQIGLVAVLPVSAYDNGYIRQHEQTRLDKVNDRIRQIEALNTQTSPVLLAHPDNDDAECLVSLIASGDPITDVINDGVRHTLWQTIDPEIITRLNTAFGTMSALYIADGHHRLAAASRIAAARRGHGAPPSSEYFLAVIFPANQMRIMDYNRVVCGLNGLSPDGFLKALETCCAVEKMPKAASPEKAGIFSLYLPGRWYRLAVHPGRIPVNDPVRGLDVSMLSDLILAPILGITDMRRDRRIDFVGGVRGLKELENRVDSGEMAAAFALYPTSISTLMSVADAGEIMPPKSTWFEPKLVDGLVSHVMD